MLNSTHFSDYFIEPINRVKRGTPVLKITNLPNFELLHQKQGKSYIVGWKLTVTVDYPVPK
jgi:hypothetical protein